MTRTVRVPPRSNQYNDEPLLSWRSFLSSSPPRRSFLFFLFHVFLEWPAQSPGGARSWASSCRTSLTLRALSRALCYPEAGSTLTLQRRTRHSRSDLPSSSPQCTYGIFYGQVFRNVSQVRPRYTSPVGRRSPCQVPSFPSRKTISGLTPSLWKERIMPGPSSGC